MTIPLAVSVLSPFSGFVYGMPSQGWQDGTGSPASGPFQNTPGSVCMYVPIYLPETFTAAIAFAATQLLDGNIAMGWYDETGNRLATTGSVASNPGDLIQSHAYTAPVTLAPGRYYIAAVGDTATPFADWFGWKFDGNATLQSGSRFAGCLEQTATFPLPAIMAPTGPALYRIPKIGAASSAAGVPP